MSRIMSEKRGSPLNNPPPEKSSVAIAPVGKTLTTDSNSRDGRERGVSKGGRERVRVAEAIVKCRMCGRKQRVVFRAGKAPDWHKCTWCGELQPTDGYHVVAYGLGLPCVLAPHEVKARELELTLLHEGA